MDCKAVEKPLVAVKAAAEVGDKRKLSERADNKAVPEEAVPASKQPRESISRGDDGERRGDGASKSAAGGATKEDAGDGSHRRGAAALRPAKEEGGRHESGRRSSDAGGAGSHSHRDRDRERESRRR